MRTIEHANAFKRDYRKAKANPRHSDLDELLAPIISALLKDRPLPKKNRDHALTGNWSGLRDCHVKPDLLLIYEKPGGTLRLVRLGSHSELFR